MKKATKGILMGCGGMAAFAVIVLNATDYDGGFAWNHGATAGIVISTQRNTVVYWTESW